MRTRWVFFSLVMLLAAVLMGCGGGGDDQRSGQDVSNRWLDMLANVPDTEETRMWAFVNDYDRARDLFEIERPSTTSGADELMDYVWKLVRFEDGTSRGLWAASMFELGGAPESLTDMRTELGFTIADVDMDVSTSSIPSEFQAVSGLISEEAVDAAVHSDPSYSSILEIRSHSGISYYSWGEDGVLEAGPLTGIRFLGRGHRLAVMDDTVFWTLTTAEIESMIDARIGGRPSLADLEQYQLIAEGLDSLDTYTALFTTDADSMSIDSAAKTMAGLDATAEQIAAARAELEKRTILLPFIAYATGAGQDENGRFTAVVLLHEDDEAARQNAERMPARVSEGVAIVLQEPWSDLITDIEVRSEGPLLLAKLYSEQSLGRMIVITKDPLFLHE